MITWMLAGGNFGAGGRSVRASKNNRLEPWGDCPFGGCGALRPGQRNPRGKTQGVRRDWPGAKAALYMAALIATRYNTVIRDFYHVYGGWQAQESSAHHSNAEHADCAQCDGRVASSLEAYWLELLTFKTIAEPVEAPIQTASRIR